MAHPARVRVIAEARIKTDKIDSLALAHLLRLGYLPCSYIPPKPLRELRGLARHRVRLGRLRKDAKNRIRALLNRRRIKLEDLGLRSPFTLEGRTALRWLEIPELDDHLDPFRGD